MEFRVLGTIDVNGSAPPGAKERAILARLLIEPGAAVPADALLDAAWEDVPRAVAARSLAVRIANLRAFLEPDRDRGAPSRLLVRDGAGYRLAIAPEQVDARRFERGVRAVQGLSPATALSELDELLALWRGAPFGDVADAEFARDEVRRLEDLRAQAREARARALVELGRPLEAVDDLRRLADADPLREELVRTLMVALYGAGRQVEALAAYRDLAARLLDLGLSPGAATRALERRILDNDATLAAPAAAPAAGASAPAPPGREHELARLRAALARARSGTRTGVLLAGAAGAGKTTLVESLLAEAERSGALAAVGQCVAQRGPGEPYMPVLEALGALARGPAGDSVVGVLASRAPTWLVELPWLLDEDERAEAVRQRAQGATRARMLREMLEALDALCAATPLVLVLEDLHWADDSTLDLVDALLRRRAPARLLLLGSYRASAPEGPAPVAELAHELSVRGLCEEVSVGALDATAVAAYLGTRFPALTLPADLAGALASRSGGNPLFMRNLLDHWLAEDVLRQHGGRLEPARPEALTTGVPPTLRAHIRHQLERLDPADAELLAAASVAGREFSVETVAAALGRDRDDVSGRCTVLAERTRLIERRDGRHGFPNDLHREVLYEQLAPDVRARLHARVGAQLADAGPAPPAELGFHFLAGRDPERAVRFLHLAADRAFGRNAHAEGIRHLRAALDAAAELAAGSERTRAEVELLSSLGQALVATGGWSAAEAEQALLRARSLAAQLSDNEPLVSVLLALATLYELRGEFARAEEMALECERLAPSGMAERELEASELFACNLFHQGSFARALDYAERGAELFEAGGAPGGFSTFPATLGDNAGVSCHDWAGLALWFLGRPDSGLARAARALELARDPSRAYSRATASAQMAVLHQCRREPEAAREWADSTIAAAQELGYVYREAMGRVLRGWAIAQLGDAGGGVREISDGLAASRGTGARMDDPHYLALLAEAQLRAGDAAAGHAAVAQALELAQRERSFFYEPELHRLDGALHAVAGRADSAEAALRRGLERAREQGSRTLELRIATDLARLLVDPAAAAEARAGVAAALAQFDEGFETRDLREAAALAQAITPAPASTSTSAPSATR